MKPRNLAPSKAKELLRLPRMIGLCPRNDLVGLPRRRAETLICTKRFGWGRHWGVQGVLLVTRIFSAFALQERHPLTGSEDHGMSQRGGSVMTHLKIGNFDSPLVKKGSADILLSLEKNEAYKTLHYLKPSLNGRDGGLCFINAPDPNDMSREIMTYLGEKGIEAYVVGADRLAREMGSPQSANIALIGFAASHPRFPFSPDKLRDAIERATPQRFRDASLKIFEKGFAEGRKSIKP